MLRHILNWCRNEEISKWRHGTNKQWNKIYSCTQGVGELGRGKKGLYSRSAPGRKQATVPTPVTHSVRDRRRTAVNSKSSFAHMQHVTDSPNNNNNNLYFSISVFGCSESIQICLCLLRVFSAFINRRLSKRCQSGKTTMKHVFPFATNKPEQERDERKKRKNINTT